MNKEKRYKIFQRFQQLNPEPTTELQYKNNFELLIAVILSAQATDVSVNKATKKLFLIANTPEKFLQLGIEHLKQAIRNIGLYNSKATNIMKTCAILINDYHSQIPNNRKNLEALPGVGRKTANVILNTAFGEKTIAVDTHVFRVCNRTKLATGKTPLAVETKLVRHIPKEFLTHAHHWLVLHGRYICIAKKPRCSTCPIVDLCEYKNKNLPSGSQ